MNRSCVVVMLLLSPLALGQEAPKPRVVAVTAEELVKEFVKDTDAAAKKYLPPKEGTSGGVLIRITGTVEAVDARNKEVALAARDGAVVLHVKNFKEPKVGERVEAVGVFRNFAKRTILIFCDELK